MEDVNNYADFYSWARLGFFNNVFQQVYNLSEYSWNFSDPVVDAAIRRYGPEERGIILNYGKVIGGVRFQQEVGHAGACPVGSDLDLFYAKACTGTAYETDPESWPARNTEKPTRQEWFYIREDTAVLEDRLLLMEAG